MDNSILESIKLSIGYEADYTPFDIELIIHINSALCKLNQLGVGINGFSITGNSETWSDFVRPEQKGFSLADIKEYVYLNVRLIHDPPANSFIVSKFNDEIKELEWRINVEVETLNEK